jgi:hypothetical protein
MISHILHFLSFCAVGEAGVMGEAGTSSGASATAGSLGATEGLVRINSPVASSIEVRISSLGDFGDENQAPGNNRDDVEDSYRVRGEIFEALEGSADMNRSNFGLSFACEYNREATNVKGDQLTSLGSRPRTRAPWGRNVVHHPWSSLSSCP